MKKYVVSFAVFLVFLAISLLINIYVSTILAYIVALTLGWFLPNTSRWVHHKLIEYKYKIKILHDTRR